MREMKLSLGTPALKTQAVGRHSLLLGLMLIVALSITACGRRPQPPDVAATPASGSIEVPAEDEATSSAAITDTATVEEGDAGDADTSEADSEAESDAAADAPAEEVTAPMAAGLQVVIVDPAGTRVRAGAGETAPVLHLYTAGEVMEILEPSGDYDAYPVTVDDLDWVRVRAADGLVGWVAVDAIEAAE